MAPWIKKSPERSFGGQISKRKPVADGVFRAERNEFLTRELAEHGYSGVEVPLTPTRTEIILATRPQNVLGEKGRRIRALNAVVRKRFGFPEGSVELCAEKVATRSGSHCPGKSLRYKPLGGPAVQRACCVEGLLWCCGSSWGWAQVCEVAVSGKLRGQRGKPMKAVDGLMTHAGPVNYTATAMRPMLLRQGELGSK